MKVFPETMGLLPLRITMSNRYRIGVDIGGTFTDLVLLDTVDDRIFHEKVLTTPQDPSQGVLTGVASILSSAGVAAADVRHVIHGTTLVANAVIERRGAKVALITTEGFRDILQIGTEWRYDIYDLFMEVPAPLVPRQLRFEAPERIGPDGSILIPLDDAAIVKLARQIEAAGVTAVAISLLHGFKNPVHEQRVREILRREVPHLAVCTSSDVMPEIGEYERTSTTVCNAYVLPVFEQYLRRLTAGLRGMGIDRDMYLMLSDGGTAHESTAAKYPIRLVQSGPAGGVQATSAIGKLSGVQNLLCFDMGGTTAKACLIDRGEPMLTTQFEVARMYRFKKGSGLPVRVPVIDMIEIGAGGGSIARVDKLGLVQIGPESSGSDPGPACYGLGGRRPTVTDADLLLGYLAPDSFLGGDMRLDLNAAEEAVRKDIAEPLSLTVIEAAWAIHETVNESMAQATSIHALENARRITDYTMIPIGGAGPVHACNIALRLGLRRVICGPGAGVASALGFLVAPTAFTFVQGGVSALEEMKFGAIRSMLSEMADRGIELLRKSDGVGAVVNVTYDAHMRYVGQGYEVEARVSIDALEDGNQQALRVAFEEAYQEKFGRIESAMPIEIVSWRVIVSGLAPRVNMVAGHSAVAASVSPRGARAVYFGAKQGFVQTPTFDRAGLVAGQRFVGPAIFEERESTMVVPPNATAYIDSALNLVIDLPSNLRGETPDA